MAEAPHSATTGGALDGVSRLVSRRGFVSALAAGALLPLAGCAGFPGSQGPAAGSADAHAATNLATISDAAAAPDRVSICMVGDVLVHPGVWMSGERGDGTRNYDHIYAQLAQTFTETDIAIVNQETILGGTALGLSGYPMFCSPQEFGDAEAAVGVDVACAATNHALDKGFEGIQAELSFWAEHHPDITCTGIFDSQERSATIPIVERNGIKVAILNYTESTNGIPIPASAPWCVAMLDRDRVASDVSAAREQGADIVIVCPHWGVEYQYQPNEAQRSWADYFLSLGVDAVIGTHPHVLEPLELLAGADGHTMPVFWSLGNYVSWQARKDTMVGGLAELAFERVADGSGVRVTSATLTPVITHLAMDPSMAVYPIAAYTEELAQANRIRTQSGAGDFTLEWCHNHCAEVLGEGYDRASGVFTLAL